MISLVWIVALFLLIVSLIDLKYNKIYSIILTGMIFFVAFIRLQISPISLYIGIMGLIMAILLFEAGYYEGIGDIKIFAIISLMLSSFLSLMAFIILMVVFGILWKILIREILPKRKKFAFIPVFFFVYVALWILGALA